MKIKKWLAIVISVMMVMSLMPATAFAEGGVTADDDGFLIMGGMLFSYSGTAEEVIIPDSVTTIVNDVFKGNTTMTKVVIPSSVTSIGASAFEGSTVLTDVSFADESNLKSIPQRAFASCPRLKSVDLPDSITTIGTGAFASCGSYLKSIQIPASVSKLGETGIDVFEGSQVAAIDIAEDNSTYYSYDGVVYLKDGNIAYFCAPGRSGSVELKSDTKAIGDKAFYKSKIDYITIPEGVTSIGIQAFASSQLGTTAIPSSVKEMGGGQNLPTLTI